MGAEDSRTACAVAGPRRVVVLVVAGSLLEGFADVGSEAPARRLPTPASTTEGLPERSTTHLETSAATTTGAVASTTATADTVGTATTVERGVDLKQRYEAQAAVCMRAWSTWEQSQHSLSEAWSSYSAGAEVIAPGRWIDTIWPPWTPPENITKVSGETAFDFLDTNSDNTLSQQEFAAGYRFAGASRREHLPPSGPVPGGAVGLFGWVAIGLAALLASVAGVLCWWHFYMRSAVDDAECKTYRSLPTSEEEAVQDGLPVPHTAASVPAPASETAPAPRALPRREQPPAAELEMQAMRNAGDTVLPPAQPQVAVTGGFVWPSLAPPRLSPPAPLDIIGLTPPGHGYFGGTALGRVPMVRVGMPTVVAEGAPVMVRVQSQPASAFVGVPQSGPAPMLMTSTKSLPVPAPAAGGGGQLSPAAAAPVDAAPESEAEAPEVGPPGESALPRAGATYYSASDVSTSAPSVSRVATLPAVPPPGGHIIAPLQLPATPAWMAAKVANAPVYAVGSPAKFHNGSGFPAYAELPNAESEVLRQRFAHGIAAETLPVS